MVLNQDRIVDNALLDRVNISNLNLKIDSTPQKKVNYLGKQLDLIEDGIDLNDYFVNCPEKTFLIKVKGNSMQGTGIDNGDILLVDGSKTAVHGNIIIASINNKLAVKRLHYSYKETMLLSENDDYMPIRPKESDRLKILGVAIMVIKDMN